VQNRGEPDIFGNYSIL